MQVVPLGKAERAEALGALAPTGKAWHHLCFAQNARVLCIDVLLTQSSLPRLGWPSNIDLAVGLAQPPVLGVICWAQVKADTANTMKHCSDWRYVVVPHPNKACSQLVS